MVGTAAVVVLWSHSKRWALQSQVHALATRNEQRIRGDTRRALDGTLLLLARGKRDCLRHQHEDDARQVSSLLHDVEVVRDQVACDYSPSVIALNNGRFELDPECLETSEVVYERSLTLARGLHGGEPLVVDDLVDLRAALGRLSREELALQ